MSQIPTTNIKDEIAEMSNLSVNTRFKIAFTWELWKAPEPKDTPSLYG